MTLRLIAVFTALVACASAVSASTTGVQDRARVGVPGSSLTSDFSQRLFVTLTAPPDYRRTPTPSLWYGPRYAPSKGGSGGETSIAWDVIYAKHVASARAAARSALIQGYPLVQGAAIRVPHVEAGRMAGTIAGSFLITSREARVEAALAFPLGRGVTAIARLDALAPSQDDAAPYGQNEVEGELASQWNREQVLKAIVGVGLEGPLPPARVSAFAGAEGRLVVGTVTDSFGHPVAGAAMRLLQGANVKATGRSDATGRYSLRVGGGRGTYRAVASLGRASSFAPPISAASGPVRAGRAARG